MDDILRHAERMLDICGENCVCLGCDLDGIPSTPEGVASVEGIEGIIGAFEKNLENRGGKNRCGQFYADYRGTVVINPCI